MATVVKGSEGRMGDNNTEPKLIRPGKLGLKLDVPATFLCPFTASGKLCLHLLASTLHKHSPLAGCKPQLPSCLYLQASFTRQRTLTDMLCRSHFCVWHSTASVMGKFIDESCEQTRRHNVNKQLGTDCTELQSRKSCFLKLCYKPFLPIGADSPKISYDPKSYKSRANSQYPTRTDTSLQRESDSCREKKKRKLKIRKTKGKRRCKSIRKGHHRKTP